MKIYTKTGDKGETGLYGGDRVLKSDLRIECYGTIDELNSFMGLIRDCNESNSLKDVIVKIQSELFTIGAMLATPKEKKKMKNGANRLTIPVISQKMIIFLESEIDKMNEELPAMTHFVLPGGHVAVSYCHVSRSICRRAERLVVKLLQETTVEKEIIEYLNRLSDYLFVLARKLTQDYKAEEIKWIP